MFSEVINTDGLVDKVKNSGDWGGSLIFSLKKEEAQLERAAKRHNPPDSISTVVELTQNLASTTSATSSPTGI